MVCAPSSESTSSTLRCLLDPLPAGPRGLGVEEEGDDWDLGEAEGDFLSVSLISESLSEVVNIDTY